MTIDELIERLNEIKNDNTEPDVPNFDPGGARVAQESAGRAPGVARR